MDDLDAEYENLRALVKRTDKENPNPEDMAELRRQLDKKNTFVRINDLTESAFERFIRTLSTSALQIELFKRQVEEKRESFGYQDASLIEKMLIDQLILNSLRLSSLEANHITKTTERHTVEVGLYWDKRLNSAQNRFLKSCETLAKVRKHLAEAELKEQQARTSRARSSVLANKLLKDLTN